MELLAGKTFDIEGHRVTVRSQDEHGAHQPHQVVVQLEMQGVTKTETSSYERAAVDNRNAQYAHFDEKAAGQFIGRFAHELATHPRINNLVE